MAGIIVLGTAGDYETMKKGRAAGGIIVDAEKHIVIDPGMGAILRAAAFKLPLEEIDIILESTTERIHTNDAEAIRDLSHAPIISPKDAQKKKDIEFLPTRLESLAFKIKTTKYILAYFSRIAYHRSLLKELKDVNIIITAYTEQEHALAKSHLVEMVEDINPELILLTGFTDNVKDPLEVTRDIKRMLQERKIPFKTQILAAKDGMIINPESYNIKLKQKSLNQF